MKNNTNKHDRHSIRIRNYDYSQFGLYFVTICAQDKKCLFGKIENHKLILNPTGKLVEKWWLKLKEKFKHIDLSDYIVMPNHFHGIIIINNKLNTVGADLCVCPKDPCVCPDIDINKNEGEHMGSPLQTMVQWFKTMTTNEYIKNVKQNNWKPFNKRFWQRNYYEHVVRDEKDLNEIREYIIYNYLKWNEDDENPDNININKK